MICHLTCLSWDVQGIFFNGERLEDHFTLKECNISNGSMVQLYPN